MKNKIILLMFCLLVLSGCVMNTNSRFVASHHVDRLKELMSDNNHYDVVFMGDSLTEIGNFEKVLKGSKNAGIIGDFIYSTEDIVPVVASYNPRKVYLMIGTNSLREYSYKDCEYQYKSLIKLITTTLPNTEIVIESVLPMSSINYKIVRFNNFVKSVCAEYGLRYIDLYSKYSVDGLLPPTVTLDGLHLSPSGYNEWYEFIKNDNKEKFMTGTQFYNNDCLTITVGETNYDVDVKARGIYTYEPETRWEPAYSDFEIEEVKAEWKDGEGNIVEETAEMYDALESYLKDKAEWEQECPYDEAEEREHYC